MALAQYLSIRLFTRSLHYIYYMRSYQDLIVSNFHIANTQIDMQGVCLTKIGNTQDKINKNIGQN